MRMSMGTDVQSGCANVLAYNQWNSQPVRLILLIFPTTN